MTAGPWSALADGDIDIIVSAHDPQDVDTKRLPFGMPRTAPSGLKRCWLRRCDFIIPAMFR
jgi:dihydroorotase-like cyclic amidohydrolase